jgi:uncharacterized membrane-anchored protein
MGLLARRRDGGRADRVVGTARVGRRTKDLVKRLQPGEIAVIDHVDLDRVAADGLVEAGVAGVVNAAASISGRYPNTGPLRIVLAGIPLVDCVGSTALDVIADGARVELDGGRVLIDDVEVASGRLLDEGEIRRRMDDAQAGIGGELERFATNTLEYIKKEAAAAFAPLVLPPLRTDFRGRHALIVVRGHDYKDDLRLLRPYIREYQPVLIGVDGGADALLELGLKPDIILGDFDSVSELAMRCGAEHVHHVHPDGRAPGREQLLAFGEPYEEFVVEGTSEDAAMLLAYEAGAKLVVAVGTHATMVEFLDKGRAGMSSTFLTRLRLGPILVDAKGVARLYEGSVRKRDLGMLVVAAFVAMVAIAVVSEPIHVFLDGIWLTLRDLWFSLTGAG